MLACQFTDPDPEHHLYIHRHQFTIDVVKYKIVDKEGNICLLLML